MAALKMFELGKLSSGKAAELAGLSRVEFFEMCGRYRVSLFNYPPEVLEAEMQSDLEAARKASLYQPVVSTIGGDRRVSNAPKKGESLVALPL